jgi:hypothetical protein
VRHGAGRRRFVHCKMKKFVEAQLGRPFGAAAAGKNNAEKN